ncbi:MAG: VOC family protein [Luteolibacter sp.]
MEPLPITRIALYVRDLPGIAEFYHTHFGFVPAPSDQTDKLTLKSPAGGCDLILLQASKGHKTGQSCVKIVFDVADVAAFREERIEAGLEFGPIHRGPGYEFTNARDPAKNLIQISNGHLAK